jgi:hypothetical protein
MQTTDTQDETGCKLGIYLELIRKELYLRILGISRLGLENSKPFISHSIFSFSFSSTFHYWISGFPDQLRAGEIHLSTWGIPTRTDPYILSGGEQTRTKLRRLLFYS